MANNRRAPKYVEKVKGKKGQYRYFYSDAEYEAYLSNKNQKTNEKIQAMQNTLKKSKPNPDKPINVQEPSYSTRKPVHPTTNHRKKSPAEMKVDKMTRTLEKPRKRPVVLKDRSYSPKPGIKVGDPMYSARKPHTHGIVVKEKDLSAKTPREYNDKEKIQILKNKIRSKKIGIVDSIKKFKKSATQQIEAMLYNGMNSVKRTLSKFKNFFVNDIPEATGATLDFVADNSQRLVSSLMPQKVERSIDDVAEMIKSGKLQPKASNTTFENVKTWEDVTKDANTWDKVGDAVNKAAWGYEKNAYKSAANNVADIFVDAASGNYDNLDDMIDDLNKVGQRAQRSHRIGNAIRGWVK